MNILRHSIGDSEIVYHYIEPFDIDCFNCGASAEETFAVEFISILKWSKVYLTWVFAAFDAGPLDYYLDPWTIIC